MTANEAIQILKPLRSQVFSAEVIQAISIAITALENIGADSAVECSQLRNYLAQAVIDFRELGEHRAKLCNMTFCSCDNCPLDVAVGGKQTCNKWVLEDEVIPLLGDMKP